MKKKILRMSFFVNKKKNEKILFRKIFSLITVKFITSPVNFAIKLISIGDTNIEIFLGIF